MLDIIIPYRADPGRDVELRYCLRSIAKYFGHDGRVWIIGDLPSWAANISHLPGNPHAEKPRNVFANILRALEHVDVADDLVLFNDDMYLMAPYQPVITHRGSLQERIQTARNPGGWYNVSLQQTATFLGRLGIRTPVSYEDHRPMPMRKTDAANALRKALGAGMKRAQARSIYGNIAEVGGALAHDVKVFGNTTHEDWRDWPIISTNEASFRDGKVGAYIRELFSEPCLFERDQPCAPSARTPAALSSRRR